MKHILRRTFLQNKVLGSVRVLHGASVDAHAQTHAQTEKQTNRPVHDIGFRELRTAVS